MTFINEVTFTENWVKDNILLVKRYIDEAVSDEEKPFIMFLIERHNEIILLERLVKVNGVQNKRVTARSENNLHIQGQLISESVVITFNYMEDVRGGLGGPIIPEKIEIKSDPQKARTYEQLNELRKSISNSTEEPSELNETLVAEYNSLVALLKQID